MNEAEAESLLRQMLGADKAFREGQWEAINEAAVRKQRVLVVQRTGLGKSICQRRAFGAGATRLRLRS